MGGYTPYTVDYWYIPAYTELVYVSCLQETRGREEEEVMFMVDADLFSIMTALEGNPSDRVSVLALRDWLQEHGGEGSPLVIPVVWVVEEAREGELNEGRGIYASKKLATDAVELLISTGPYPKLFRRVRDDGEHLDWEAGTHSIYLYAYKVKTALE